jgi:hypothetical protein
VAKGVGGSECYVDVGFLENVDDVQSSFAGVSECGPVLFHCGGFLAVTCPEFAVFDRE